MTRNTKFKIKHPTLLICFLSFFILLFTFNYSWAADAEFTRQTIKGLKAVHVIVEDIQPNIQKYADKAGINKAQIQKDVEARLKAGGFKVLDSSEWPKTPGKPVLYVNINTHETEKYWYAYNVELELKQVVYLETNPSIKTLATTWSTNMTGMANIGTLGNIRKAVSVLVDSFINAHSCPK